MMHLNDSKMPMGSRRDRHELIGEGCIGQKAFRRIMTDPGSPRSRRSSRRPSWTMRRRPIGACWRCSKLCLTGAGGSHRADQEIPAVADHPGRAPAKRRPIAVSITARDPACCLAPTSAVQSARVCKPVSRDAFTSTITNCRRASYVVIQRQSPEPSHARRGCRTRSITMAVSETNAGEACAQCARIKARAGQFRAR